MKQMWLWLGAIAMGIGFLGLVLGSVFDLSGHVTYEGPGYVCVSDSMYQYVSADGAKGRLTECPLGYRCVPEKGRCAEVGNWACLDANTRIFVPAAGTPAGFAVENCQTNYRCMGEIGGAMCIGNRQIEDNPGRYLEFVWV